MARLGLALPSHLTTALVLRLKLIRTMPRERSRGKRNFCGRRVEQAVDQLLAKPHDAVQSAQHPQKTGYF